LGEVAIPQGVIHIERSRFLCDGRVHERLKLRNYSGQAAAVPLEFTFAADFADIFEVQGHRRTRRGTLLEPTFADGMLQLSYVGLDHKERTTQVSFAPAPLSWSATAAKFLMQLPRDGTAELYMEVGPPPARRPSAERFSAARESLAQTMRGRVSEGAAIETSGRLFNEWIDKSRADLALLTTTLPTGPYPYAGIPWFATQFGRDAIITALQTLWLNPDLAAGVLRFLALTQAQEASAFRDAEPGKIMHEMRRGEMAVLHEVPFRQYYGGVDTTPLFVMLAGAYEQRTGNPALVDEIWGNLVAATGWIERRLERSRSGLLDYARAAESGLANQGWKDSYDSIFHADGRLPSGPVAVVEVQGYACAALQSIARLAHARGLLEQEERWRRIAQRLVENAEKRFWMPDAGFYALAIDGENEPCRVRASNAGHLLYCGLPGPERAASTANELLGPAFRSGWGIRTLARGEARYNPMSYHNGSVWPHDVALCAAGIARYCGAARIVPLVSELFEAANQFTMRLPELYCGFTRTPGQGPTPYPVACLPQAWASGALFMLLQAVLGIRIDGARKEVHLEQPALPIGIEALTIRSLPVGEERVELLFRRLGDRVVATPEGAAPSAVRVVTHL
ncbi:MAG: amylo-alpha-1,6-glucosidase, partial [Gammaproteobacteria bacterium]|nr:amylo-alpha-1,6-glucosidase [Gammaproteobacteria bacterium]